MEVASISSRLAGTAWNGPGSASFWLNTKFPVRDAAGRQFIASIGEELQVIMDATPVALFVAHDPQCQLMTGNHRAHELFGVSLEEKNLSATPSTQGEEPFFRIYRRGQEVCGPDLPMQVAAAAGVFVRDQELEVLRRISESAVRMDHLITDALQYSRVVRDRFPLQPIDPAAAIRGLIESYPQLQPPYAHVTVQSQMPRILARQAGFTQVFSNLLGNAAKFVAPSQVPQISVTAQVMPPRSTIDKTPPEAQESRPPTTWVRICVTDNGIDIPPEYQARIWQMFQRLSKHYEGTGIGLALVRKVVERMHGRIGVESSPGQGNRFWVELQKAP